MYITLSTEEFLKAYITTCGLREQHIAVGFRATTSCSNRGKPRLCASITSKLPLEGTDRSIGSTQQTMHFAFGINDSTDSNKTWTR